MKRVDEAAFRDGPSGYLDRAKAETVIITENGEPSLVVLSWEVFSQLRRGNRQALRIDELSEEDIDSIAAARMPLGHDHLNSELDENDPDEPEGR